MDQEDQLESGDSDERGHRWRKRSRCSKFSVEEKNLLIYIVNQHQDTIECKQIDETSIAKKDAVWKTIANEFNELSLGEHERTCNQLKVCYVNLKKKLRQHIASNKSGSISDNTTQLDAASLSASKDNLSNVSVCDAESFSSVICATSPGYLSTPTDRVGRCLNFTAKEKNLLVTIINKYEKELECKKIDKESVLKRANVWEKMKQEFNDSSMSQCERSILQLKVCYKNIRTRAKRENEMQTDLLTEDMRNIEDPAFVVEVKSSDRVNRRVLPDNIVDPSEELLSMEDGSPGSDNEPDAITNLRGTPVLNKYSSVDHVGPVSNAQSNASTLHATLEDDSESSTAMKKRRRCSNFSDEERGILLEVVEKYKNLLGCKKVDKVSVIARENLWRKVKREFNELTMGRHRRTARQLKVCYENLKKRQSKETRLTQTNSLVENNSSNVFKELGSASFIMNDSSSDISDSEGESNSSMLHAVSPDFTANEHLAINKRILNKRIGKKHSARFNNRSTSSLDRLKRALLIKEFKLLNWEAKMKAKKYELEFKTAEAKYKFYRAKTVALEKSGMNGTLR